MVLLTAAEGTYTIRFWITMWLSWRWLSILPDLFEKNGNRDEERRIK